MDEIDEEDTGLLLLNGRFFLAFDEPDEEDEGVELHDLCLFGIL